VGPMPYGITWLLMSPWRSYIIRHDQSGFSHPNYKGEKGGKINNIHNVVNNENESNKYI
jgi:formylmethanofuran dehydrogenase subunit D